MSNSDYYPHPNTNADIYRNMTAADRPPVPDKHIQFIAVNDDKTIVGASSLTDRYWSGTVWYFNGPTNYDKNDAYAVTRTESGVCDAVFLDNYKFLIAEDSGVLQVLEVVKAPETLAPVLQCSGYVCQHDDSITSLAVFDNKTHFVTSSMDCCIKVWQISDLLAEYSFLNAHTNSITCVDVMPKNDWIFGSTSLDCQAFIWDLRQSKPATCLHKKEGNGLTALTWDKNNENIVAIGSQSGSVTLIDIRSPDNVICETQIFLRPVHRLKYHPEKNSWLAGCCDDTVVKVLDPTKHLSLVYQDDRHKDFVRGLAWLQDELLTCSWDDTILKHTVLSADQ
ncbi:methylosome protein 50-like [Microplitis mediator]|uniref:methylosome protein 50-like n=1 Tax=Microplitis mediator TaxID=375433 RepID=UPI0025542DEA|nr:methylosome protein 50-like [Microplitis mediator]